MPPDASRFRVRPFVLAAAVSAALILAAPFIGEIRRAILLRFPDQFVRIIGTIVLLAAAAAILAGLVRIRDRRVTRYAALAASIAIAAVYTYLTRTPDPQVNAVERFHFVEYGLITFLFYRAWRPAGDLSAVVLPVLAGLLVGSLEEWFQWLIPARVGDVADVFLNGVAIVCGLIFSTALEPIDGLRVTITPAGRRRIGAFAAVALLVFAGFFHGVHLGHVIEGNGWRFRSGFTPARLQELSADRAERWRGVFIGRPERISIEDQYMTEGLWHVEHRNKAWTAGDVVAAWRENQILETYFAPVLDTPSYVSKTGHRWSAGHRADAEQRFGEVGSGDAYESAAHPSAIFVWPNGMYWTFVGLCAVSFAWPWVRARLSSRRPRRAVEPL